MPWHSDGFTDAINIQTHYGYHTGAALLSNGILVKLTRKEKVLRKKSYLHVTKCDHNTPEKGCVTGLGYRPHSHSPVQQSSAGQGALPSH